jgi:hypothetical protein
MNLNNAIGEDSNEVLRPYFDTFLPYDDMLATIIITNKTEPAKSSTSIDYFTSLKTAVNTVDNGAIIDTKENVVPMGKRGVFRNFSLIGVNEANVEAVKISLNFGMGWNAYFFGEQPKVYSFSGVFLDTKNYPYYEEFMTYYRTHLSGSNVARKGYRFYIVYDSKILTGYMLGINVNSDSANYQNKTFNFQVLVDTENFFRTGLPAPVEYQTTTESGFIVT